MAEQEAVNFKAVGSSPAGGALKLVLDKIWILCYNIDNTKGEKIC